MNDGPSNSPFPLPTAREINPHPGDLDGQSAEQHFLGKSVEEAEALFRDAPLYYQEDLVYMGPVAFRFYVPACIHYIRSDDSTGDSDIINCLTSIFEHWLKHQPQELRPIARQLAGACDYVLQNYDKFTLDPEIYGDLRPRWQTLQLAFARLSG